MDPSTSDNAHKQLTQRTLPELMASLPQELYDHIYDEAVTTPPRAVTISNGLGAARPIPGLLQVSRGMREDVLGSYYANTTFICCADVYSPDVFLPHLFPESHLSEFRIRDIRVYDSPACDCSDRGCSECNDPAVLSYFLEEWRDACGEDAKIEVYQREGQLYAALAREGIKVCKMA